MNGWLILLLAASFSVAQRVQVKLKLEIALIIVDSSIMEKSERDAVWLAVGELPEYFSMDANLARVAAVSIEGGQAKVLFELTDKEETVQSLDYSMIDSKKVKPGGLQHALKTVREQIFAKARPDAQKMAVVVALGYGAKPSDIVDPKLDVRVIEAEALRRSGSLIFVMRIRDYHLKLANGITGNPSNVHYLPKEDSFGSLRDQLTREFHCWFVEACRFDDPKQEKCKPGWWRPNDQGATCNNSEPTSAVHKCEKDDCTRLCDQLWPWSKRECGAQECVKEVRVDRQGAMPAGRKTLLENCLKSRVMACLKGCTIFELKTVTNDFTI